MYTFDVLLSFLTLGWLSSLWWFVAEAFGGPILACLLLGTGPLWFDCSYFLFDSVHCHHFIGGVVQFISFRISLTLFVYYNYLFMHYLLL